MPYSYHKEGDKYVVTKKDSGKVVGRTKGTKEALKNYLAALHINANEGKINEGTPEQEKIKKVVSNYVNLRKAIDSPNYPSTPHTYSAMKKIENILQQMNRKADMHYSLMKILPSEYHDILKESNTMKKSELTQMIQEIIKEVISEQINTTPKHKIIAQLLGPDFFLSKKPESTWDEKDHDLFNRISKMASETGKVPKMSESVDYDTAVAYRITVPNGGNRDEIILKVQALLDNLTAGKSKKFPEVKVSLIASKGNPQDIILKLNGPGAFSMSKDIKSRPELKGLKVSTYKPQLTKV